MKTFIKIIGGIFTVVLIVVLAAFYFTSGLTDTADRFFLAVKNNNIDKAYDFTSEDFRSKTSKIELENFLKEYSFNNYKQAHWSSRSVHNSTGELEGTIRTINEAVLPITMTFVKTDGDWKILSINKPASGLQQTIKTTQMPSEQELVKLISNTMLLFAQSVKKQNMQILRDSSSSLFQKQVSLKQFNDGYQSFFKFGDKLMVVERLSPQFSEKALINKDNGTLQIKGFYASADSDLVFDAQYNYEGYGWKLLGLSVNTN